jgi:thymidylate synthase (FAD)
MTETKRATSETAEALLGEYFPVLDHGFVALVDYMGTDNTVPTCARTSYGHGTKAGSNDRGLVRYLRRKMHTSPFEFVELHFHCSMPIFVARQWIRHRTAAVNEVSGRYSLLPMLFHTPELGNFAKQSSNNKQGREDSETDSETHSKAVQRWIDGRITTKDNYEWLLAEDVARELARIDLPLSTYTQWRWKIDAHNLMHFLTLRCDDHAQWEIRAFANVIAGILQQGWPNMFSAWADYNFKSHNFSRQEMLILCALLEKLTLSPGSSTRTLIEDLSKEHGLSNRELDEFLTAFSSKDYQPADFELPGARPIEDFVREAEAAVPKERTT